MEDEWLKTYYGKDFNTFSPVVFMESKNFAIVRLLGEGKGARMGFVLIRKSGSFERSSQRSMKEGTANSDDLVVFRAALNEAEKEGKL